MSELSIRQKIISLIRPILFAIVLGACLFAATGSISWWNGWVFLAVYLETVILVTVLVFWNDPDLVQERKQAGRKAKSWDKKLLPVLAGILPLLEILLAGFDKRVHFTVPLPLAVPLVSLVIMITASLWTLWAMRSNPFFSSHVRIQDDRNQVVISHGPYRFVRHPGYTGAILTNISVALLLESCLALIAGVGVAILFVFRTYKEDKTLQGELPGYQEYTRKVKFRLAPFIW